MTSKPETQVLHATFTGVVQTVSKAEGDLLMVAVRTDAPNISPMQFNLAVNRNDFGAWVPGNIVYFTARVYDPKDWPAAPR